MRTAAENCLCYIRAVNIYVYTLNILFLLQISKKKNYIPSLQKSKKKKKINKNK